MFENCCGKCKNDGKDCFQYAEGTNTNVDTCICGHLKNMHITNGKCISFQYIYIYHIFVYIYIFYFSILLFFLYL